LLGGGRVLVTRAEEMGRGQAERLIPLLEEVLAEGGVTWRDLARIGVGIGPGNFTGIRISVAAARGLALALEIPAIGVSTFDAICAGGGHGTAVVPAPHGMVHVATPALLPVESVADPLWPPAPALLAQAIARIAQDAPNDSPPPAPLYLRPADAAPARDAPPVILDDA
jgi:tRNA A37 threonylcarbamoyladenosine modification protein TsaB